MKPKVVNYLRLAALVCLLLGAGSAGAFAQSRGFTVKGKVIDSQALPVIGAGVTVKGTTTGGRPKKITIETKRI